MASPPPPFVSGRRGQLLGLQRLAICLVCGCAFGQRLFPPRTSTVQAVVKTLFMLTGGRFGLPSRKEHRVTFSIKSDATAALGAWIRERSSNKRGNGIVREMVLDLAEGWPRFDLAE